MERIKPNKALRVIAELYNLHFEYMLQSSEPYDKAYCVGRACYEAAESLLMEIIQEDMYNTLSAIHALIKSHE